MDTPSDLVTIFRSMDTTAEQDCEILSGQLREQGLHPHCVNDTSVGVMEGVYELRVPESEVAQAEAWIEEHPLPDEVEEVDDSSELDLETIYHSDSSVTAEIEVVGIQAILENEGIAAVVVGDTVLPNMPFEVKVARDQVERAKQVIAEAEARGPAAAEEAEREGEEAQAASEAEQA